MSENLPTAEAAALNESSAGKGPAVQDLWDCSTIDRPDVYLHLQYLVAPLALHSIQPMEKFCTFSNCRDYPNQRYGASVWKQ
jgi:hypothetical protein